MAHIEYQIERYCGYIKSNNTIRYEVINTGTDISKILEEYNKIVYSNITQVYRLIRVLVDGMKISRPID